MPDNTRQKESPSYRMAALDPDFILGDSMRGARFMLEYQKAEDSLRARGVVSTIVVFGSARVREGNPWYEAARQFGRIASERGGALSNPHVADERHALSDERRLVHRWRSKLLPVLYLAHFFSPSCSRASAALAISPPSDSTISRARATSTALLSASTPLER